MKCGILKFSIFQEERSNCGGVCVGGVCGGGGERTSGLFVKSFLPAFRKKTTQEHLFKSHRSAREVRVDSDILENFSRNGSYVVLARSHSIDSIHLRPNALYVVIVTKSITYLKNVCKEIFRSESSPHCALAKFQKLCQNRECTFWTWEWKG